MVVDFGYIIQEVGGHRDQRPSPIRVGPNSSTLTLNL
jgi:hypothetical protein